MGALIGTVALASLGNVRRKGLMVLVAAMGAALTTMLFSTTSTLTTSMVVMVVMGAMHMFYMASNNTLIQTIVPDTLRGRVLSLFMLDFALTSIGAAMAGAIVREFGISQGFLFGGDVRAGAVHRGGGGVQAVAGGGFKWKKGVPPPFSLGYVVGWWAISVCPQGGADGALESLLGAPLLMVGSGCADDGTWWNNWSGRSVIRVRDPRGPLP